MSALRKQFGRQLQRLRRERKLTQEQLAEATGLSVEFLSNIERGINAPSFETLERLSKALDVSINTLFTFPE